MKAYYLLDVKDLYKKFLIRLAQQGIGSAVGSGLRYLARRFGVYHDLQPYEYVQRLVERSLHVFLNCQPNQISRFVIVGAHLGHEVPLLSRRYPQADFILFEASPRYFADLRYRFHKDKRVQVFNCAISEVNGDLPFYETNLAGSGSLLRVGELASVSYGMQQTEVYNVVARRLEDHAIEYDYRNKFTDCLWIDVQGAEMSVLKSAGEMLCNIRSIFVEVSAYKPLYNEGAVLSDISSYLLPRGFTLVALGTDPVNWTGNALYVRTSEFKY